MGLSFVSLDAIAPERLVALHANPQVRRHLPLATDDFDLATCRRWIADKQALWAQHGYGPWAILVDGQFAGWGGLQPEGDDADLALVLDPRHWGRGPSVVRRMLRWAFTQRGLPSVTALLPPSRVRLGALRRLGFEPSGVARVGGLAFARFRLRAPGIDGDAPRGHRQ